MKCLVVITHPLKESLCYSLGQHVIEKLNQRGHEVEIEYLYESGFSPTLSQQERLSYYDERYDTSLVEPHVHNLTESQAIVLVYPTWWFSFPAVLKGWFDRVWGPGIAYDHANDYGPISPRLGNLSKVLVVTTLGAPWWVDRLVMRQPLKRVLKYGIVGTCARSVKLTYLSLYCSEKISVDRFNRFTKKIDVALQNW